TRRERLGFLAPAGGGERRLREVGRVAQPERERADAAVRAALERGEDPPHLRRRRGPPAQSREERSGERSGRVRRELALDLVPERVRLALRSGDQRAAQRLAERIPD